MPVVSTPMNVSTSFRPITMLAVSYQVMLVKASHPARNVAEFVAAARQRPGELNYASIGIGSAPHLTAEIFKAAANVENGLPST